MRIGMAADHGGFELKEQLVEEIRGMGDKVAKIERSEEQPW